MKNTFSLIIKRVKTLSFKNIVEGIIVALVVSLIGYGSKKTTDNDNTDSEVTTIESEIIDKKDLIEEKKTPELSDKKVKTEKQNSTSSAVILNKKPTKKKESNIVDFFLNKPLKNSSKKTISFFVVRQGTIDSKTTRMISIATKKNNINTTILFGPNNLNYFENFLSPTTSFLRKTKITEYTDFYFICESDPLETEKDIAKGYFTSNLKVEGYLVNTKNSEITPFTYNTTLKGVGNTKNDAIQNVNEDLIDKIVLFINSNIENT